MLKSYQPRTRLKNELKLQIVDLVLSGKMSSQQAAKSFGIKDSSTINKWIRKLGLTTPKSSSTVTIDENDPEVLKQKLKLLEEQLKLERIRNEGLNMMIDLAEQDLKISIRKKGSTK